jgi:TPR repeat protein
MKDIIKILLLIAFAFICRYYIVEYPTYDKAKNQNDAVAQFELGRRYYSGRISGGRFGGHEQDYKEAVKWWFKAAEQGNADAQYGLGCCYEEGHGVDKDLSEALRWYGKAAEQGSAYAQNRMGYCYEKGYCVTRDYNLAFEWYKKSAEQRYDVAQYNLGRCYEEGRGVDKDLNEAVEWYRKAAKQRNKNARDRLKALGVD